MKVLKRVPDAERNKIVVPILLNKKAMNSSNLNNERNQAKVMFAPLIEVCVFQPIIDPELKAQLYYSREELCIIHKRVQLACLFVRNAEKQEMVEKRIRECKLLVDDIHKVEFVPRTKRSIELISEGNQKRQRRLSVLV
jgi:hypothetical protein